MKKEINTLCEECSHVQTDIQYLCEECGMLLNEHFVYEIGYKCSLMKKGNRLILTIGNTDYDFCSLECLYQFINKEIRKDKL